MTDRPILFSAPMVRALLAGRKTQTRRVAKFQPSDKADRDVATAVCWPKTAEGDRLWVREAFADANDHGVETILYRADGHRVEFDLFDVNPEDLPNSYDFATWAAALEAGVEGRWRPSIFMPRWASRLTLVVTDVRVQRLCDIDGLDAIAEGVTRVEGEAPWRSFKHLWDSLNAARGFGWVENPWVVATTFTVQHGNIDGLVK
ncbi:MAG: hypothetical protein AAF764_00715 [Pseudomonadota bacterium]